MSTPDHELRRYCPECDRSLEAEYWYPGITDMCIECHTGGRICDNDDAYICIVEYRGREEDGHKIYECRYCGEPMEEPK